MPAGLQNDVVSLGYQEPDAAANRRGWECAAMAECGSPAQLGSNRPQRTAATQQEEEERHLSLGRHLPCDALRSAQIPVIETLLLTGDLHLKALCGAAGAAVRGGSGGPRAQHHPLHHSSQVSLLRGR